MNLFDILACPNCKVSVSQQDDTLICPSCNQAYPIINGVPVLFPDGSVPDIQHESELALRHSYDPWVHRTILQSLNDDQVVLEIGSGNMALDDPCIIRSDVTLTPYVDVVADAHALPFLPESLDYVFSLAVFEHLRNPFQASQSIYEVLKDGGYIYHECNFVFPYHGYPHHYFNATMQGMEQIFAQYTDLRMGVAPYQMPSFMLNAVLGSYVGHSKAHEHEHGKRLTDALLKILDMNLVDFDIYFSEEEALNVAAGTYYSGYKQELVDSSLIPKPIRDIVNHDAALSQRFANSNDLTKPDNVLLWAKHEGRQAYPEIEAYYAGRRQFSKHEADKE